jgi:hypothetical protein
MMMTSADVCLQMNADAQIHPQISAQSTSQMQRSEQVLRSMCVVVSVCVGVGVC